MKIYSMSYSFGNGRSAALVKVYIVRFVAAVFDRADIMIYNIIPFIAPIYKICVDLVNACQNVGVFPPGGNVDHMNGG